LVETNFSISEGRMKMLRTFNILLLFLSIAVLPTAAETITVADAKNHIGGQVTVCGRITSEFEANTSLSNDSAKFIYLDNTESFSVLTWFRDKAKVGTLPVSENFCARGVINKYSPEDLIIFEPCPKVGMCTYHNSKSTGGSQVVLRNSSNWYVPKAPSSINECTPEMSESECDNKIESDLAFAVRNKKEGCLFEPKWRPTNLSGSRTIHLDAVYESSFVVAIDGKEYILQNNDCEGQSCSRWKPEVGRDYYAEITDQPKYLNTCLHRILPARRVVCIGFGKMTEETFPYGVSRTPEFDICYSASAAPIDLPPAHVPVPTTATVAPIPAQIPLKKPSALPLSNDNYYTNSSGNLVHAPAYAPSVPAGATAQCVDGTYSFSQHRSGTCSHHGGVARWL
jgi:hypothetical protein